VSRIHLVQGDTRPAIDVQLRTPGGGLVDVSSALAVFMRFKPYDLDLVLFEVTGEPLSGTLQANLIDADETQYFIPGSGGRVRFRFNEGNLAVPVGRYVGEVEAVFGPGNSLTPYPRLQFVVRKALG
jgi:hypothetical protein